MRVLNAVILRAAAGGPRTAAVPLSPTPGINYSSPERIIRHIMLVDDLKIDSRIKDILKAQGISKLYPPQEKAIVPALEGKNVVLAVPTASGKSLVAYLTILDAVLRSGKAIYIVPLRALASEKFDDLQEFARLGLRVGMTVGDYDSPNPDLERYDVIVATSEKADSLLRHKSDWLHKIRVVVADEIHLINDADRGPTLEVTLAKFRVYSPNVQIIALSATIGNSIELADWLGAVHVKSSWRPVPLREGVLYAGEIYYSDSKSEPFAKRGDALLGLVEDCVEKGGQCLVFANTRKSAEAAAEKCAKMLSKALPEADLERFAKVAYGIGGIEEESTSMGSRLSTCISRGAAFHHAGLTNAQRKTVERSFREGSIKCICATPTLAAGINMPARRVIIKDTKRFDENFGYKRIPVLEIKQMCGRAGRPRYDKEGEAIFLAASDSERDGIIDNYIFGAVEDIDSKLGAEPALRTHLLAAIATDYVNNRDQIYKFIDRTFFSYKGTVSDIEENVEKVLQFLEAEKLVEGKSEFRATLFGKRTSDLYIDPLSAVRLRDALQKATWQTKDMGYLHAVCSTPDVSPLYLRKTDGWVEERYKECKDTIILPVPDECAKPAEYEFFLSEFKTACVIDDWIGELPEDTIAARYGIGPGDIRTKVENAEWLAYSMAELGRIFNPNVIRHIDRLVERIQSGAKEELLDLIRLKGIGRKRARSLHDRGIKTVGDVRGADVRKVSDVPGIGDRLALSIKNEADRLGR